MMNEIKKIVKRKQFLIIAVLLFVADILDFLVTCKCYYGTTLSYVRSAYRCTILKNDIGIATTQFYSTLMPILACLACSDIYYEEAALGMTSYTYTRKNKKKDIHHKMAAVAITVFFLYFLFLLFNLFLAVNAFPIQGHYSSNTTYLTLVEPDAKKILSWLEAFHPYWNIICFMIIRSMIAMVIAMFSFSVSLFHRVNRYVVLLSGFIYFILYNNVTKIPNNEFINTNILGVNSYGSIWAIVVFCVGTFLLSLGLMAIGERKDNVS